MCKWRANLWKIMARVLDIDGQVCAMETWVGRDNPREGLRIEEEFVVTKDVAELVSKWPVDQITECWI
jgi:uncharacterized HAD superfamily protein